MRQTIAAKNISAISSSVYLLPPFNLLKILNTHLQVFLSSGKDIKPSVYRYSY